MASRTGLEAEAITRLTDGLQPPAIRAILVQCLAGEVAPSAAISQMLGIGGALTARATIDEVTHRAATLSRASDRLVQDRVDELTQIFVEQVASLADVSDGIKRAPDAFTRRSGESGQFSTPDAGLD
ncbi:MAG TPA: hypothetical protein VFP26_07685 [Gemmatimonadaceae bacterium]|jgi:hypothetical protein|nr:hypothetical protein [Gemmatimonadaceae bacterium]